jgi:hypothetical protein
VSTRSARGGGCPVGGRCVLCWSTEPAAAWHVPITSCRPGVFRSPQVTSFLSGFPSSSELESPSSSGLCSRWAKEDFTALPSSHFTFACFLSARGCVAVPVAHAPCPARRCRVDHVLP